jgi:hypothetical protein
LFKLINLPDFAPEQRSLFDELLGDFLGDLVVGTSALDAFTASTMIDLVTGALVNCLASAFVFTHT